MDPADGDLKGRARPQSPTASPGTEPNRRISDPDPSTGASKGPPVLPILAPHRQDTLNRYRRGVLDAEQVGQLRQRAADGTPKATLAREFGVSRETVYQYLRASPGAEQAG